MAATRLGFGVTLLALLLAAGASPAHAQAESRCSAQKLKAAGVYFAALARCRSKAVAKAVPTDTACTEKAAMKLAAAIERAEGKGDCLTLEAELPVSEPLAAAAAAVHLILAPTCCALASQCAWLSEESCVSRKGTPGAPGTVCSGSGACVAPPAQAGACCEDAVLGRSMRICLGNAVEGDCTAQDGTFSASAFCRPNQTCVAP
jgi:hypothetical protein